MKKVFSGKATAAFAAAAMCAWMAAASCPAAGKPAGKQPDAKKIYGDAEKKTRALKDYHHKFEFKDIDEKTGKIKSIVCEFWYMQPDFQKLSVLQGNHAGSSVAYNPAKSKKTVAVKQNGVALPGGLKKSDKQIKDFFIAGWLENFTRFDEETKGAAFALDGSEKVAGRDAYRIQITPAKGSEFSKITVWIDKKDSLLVKYAYFKNGKFYSQKSWFDIKTDAGLKDEDFTP